MRLNMILLCVVVTRMEMRDCTSYSGHKVYRLYPNQEQLELLKPIENKPGFDIWTSGRVPDDPLDVMVARDHQKNFYLFLKGNHIRFETLIQDVQATIDAERERQQNATKRAEGTIQFNQYYQHDEINKILSEMSAKHPDVASLVTIGKSTEGRDLNVIKISRGGNNPVIWIDAGIHAREWIAPAMALYVINQLLEVPANNYLLDGVDWHILPVVNPDGYQWSHTKDRMWSKTRSRTSSPNCLGVDPDKNWDFHWGEKDIPTSPCSTYYYGPEAFSEPETAAIRDHLLMETYKHTFYMSLHSYGGYIMYPWAWTNKELPDNWKVLDELARKADAAQVEIGGSLYSVGAAANVVGISLGTSSDWAAGVANISNSYIVELPGGGSQGFDLPASKIEKTVREFFAAVVIFAHHVIGAK